MEKTITLSVGGGQISIKQIEDRDFFVVDEIELPNEKPYYCNGIWKDEAIFLCGRETDKYTLRFQTEVLLALLESTKTLVEKPDTRWWSSQEQLHTTFKEIFHTDEVEQLRNEVAELKEKLAAKKKK